MEKHVYAKIYDMYGTTDGVLHEYPFSEKLYRYYEVQLPHGTFMCNPTEVEFLND